MPMPFPSAALSAGNLVKLRGDANTNPRWYGNQFVSLCPNDNVLVCQVNGTPSGASFAQFNYDNVTSGSYASVRQDMTILISHTNDRRAAFVALRAWAVPTSSIIYINETSAPITDNDYVYIISDYRLWDKLPREVSGVQYKDYSVSFRQLLPVIRGLQSAYAGWCNASDVLRLTLDASASYAATSGATISTYSWEVPAGTTYISGSSSTSSITIDIPHSTGAWIHLTVTDSGSRVSIRHIFVHPASTTYPPATGFTGAQIDGDWESGWNASIEGFAGVSDILDHTFCVLWTQEWYNDTEGAIVNGVDFVGRFRQESIETRVDETYSAVQNVRYQIEGPAAQLARITAPRLALTLAASPDTWDEITNLTIWRAIVHVLEHSTFLNLHDLAFHSVDNTFLYLALGVQGGDLFRCVNDLAESINAYLEFAPQGEARVMRSAWHLSAADRNALVTYANWTTQDALDFVLNTDPVITVGKVPSSGGYYDSTAGIETPLLALAPGVAQDIGTEEPQLTRQILAATSSQSTAQSELNTRAGHELKFRREANTLTIPHPDGYHLLIPSRAIWYTWTIAATDNARGIAYTTATRWLIQRIGITHNNDNGTRDVSATYVQETSGAAGQTIQYPSTTEITPAVPEIPPFDAYLAFPELPQLWYEDSPAVTDIAPSLDSGQIPKDGSAVIAVGGTQAVLTKEFLKTASPPFRDVTPESGASAASPWSQVYDFTIDDGGWTPYSDTGFTPNTRGTHAAGTGWQSVELSSTGNPLPPDNRASECDIALDFDATTVTDIAVTYDLTQGTWNLDTFPSHLYGKLNGATVFTVDSATPDGTGTNKTLVFSGSAAIDRIEIWTYSSFFQTPGSFGSSTIKSVVIEGVDVNPFTTPTISAINHVCFDPLTGPTQVGAYLLCDNGSSSFVYHTDDVFANPPTWNASSLYAGLYKTLRTTKTAGTVLIYAPAVGGNAVVRVSTDYGQTFGAAVTVGVSPGSSGGFDVAGVGGTVSYAALQDRPAKATTFGGAYSNAGASLATSICYLIIPWYQHNSDTVQNTGSSPHYWIGLSASVAGASLLRDDGTGARTDVTPVVGGTDALFTSANFLSAWKGRRIACVGNISGTPHVFTSVDAGTNWSDRGAVSGCTMVLIRRRANTPGQLFMNAASGQMKYMPRAFTSSTIVTKQTPLSSIAGFDIWG
jgi:hypothetical protein